MAKGERDWTRIRLYYEDGHTLRECQAQFGFSNNAWSKAVALGLVHPRPRAAVKVRHDTREAVARLLADGLTQAEVAFRLGLSKPTVSYHCRQLGVPLDAKAARRFDWAEVQRAHDEGLTARECQAKFGFSNSAWHGAVKRGALVAQSTVIPIEDLLVAGRRRNRGHLRERILKAGLKEERCEECGLDSWLGRPLRVTLHHINGDQHDHRLENLQFLCPNCHSQTPNFAGRNGRGRYVTVSSPLSTPPPLPYDESSLAK